MQGFLSEEQQRRAKAEADLPPLPPLLAQILAETRAKQAAAKEGREYVPERKAGADGNASDGEAKPPSGPLLLEGPSSGLVVQGTNVPERQPGDSDSDSDAEPEAPLGPLDPARCRVHGPGFSGGAAAAPVKLTLTARDANGKRIREGGAHVLVMVEPPRVPGAEEEPEPIQAEVTDHGDGTYTAVYAVPAKGNYQLHIEVNGEPVGDSPYPLFFSAPKPAAEGGAAPAPGAAAVPGMPVQPPAGQASLVPLPAPVTTAAGIQVVTAQSIKAAQAQTQTQLGAAAAAGDLGASVALAAGYPALGGAAQQNSLGAEMVRSGLAFPALEGDQLQRMVVVGGVMALATPDAVKSVFSLSGAITGCTLGPPGTGFAFVTFSTPREAAAALAMGGVSLMGQPLKVELATEAKKAADAALAAHNPYAALQAQQVAHFQMLQQQQAALAQQVATMRAAARTGVTLPLDQRIVLKKDADGSERRRSRSRSRERGRRDRSRSRDRKRSHRSRSRSRGRGRRDRSRSRSRDRKRAHRSRSRERGSHRHKEHKHKHRHHHKRSHRSRSRERDGRKDDKSAGGDKMEADAVAAEQQQQKQQMPAAGGDKDDLEALLDEFEG